jgi:N-acetylneuraminic acid mutarotase
MNRAHAHRGIAVSLLLVSFGVSARDLTFEERVRAQESIERVYYAHQIGATRTFEEAVPLEVLEQKVTTYLKQSAALEIYWHTPVTAEMLRRETERQAQGTRMPERLRELYGALGNDPVLIAECLARPTLVDRMSRSFFAFDETIHAEQRRSAESLRHALRAERIDPFAEHPRRSVSDFVRSDPKDEGHGPSATEAAGPHRGEVPPRVRLASSEHQRRRASLPAIVGEPGPIVDERDTFAVEVVLQERTDEFRVARFAVAKRAWSDWWREVEGSLLASSIEVVARKDLALAEPSSEATRSRASDFSEDTWHVGALQGVDSRTRHAAVWTGSVMLIWGGSRYKWPLYREYLTTGDRYDPATDSWTAMSTVGAPAGRSYPTAVWTGKQMLVWGGEDDDVRVNYVDTGGAYDPSTDQWVSTSTVGAPVGRRSHTAVWTGRRMIVWGGVSYDGAIHYLDNGARYDPETDTWSPTSTIDAPEGRTAHTAVWTGTQMIVWGGYSDDGGGIHRNTGGRYDHETDTSSPTSLGPSGRFGHTAVWTGGKMIVWGGYRNGYLNNGGRYDPRTDTWRRVSTLSAPDARSHHRAHWTGSEMIVWGGNQRTTGGRYDPSTNTWRPTSTVGAPTARYEFTTVWTGTHVIVWGGYGDDDLNTGGRYDPASDSWTPTFIGSGPEARTSHTAVWTGSVMLVWGGYDGESTYLNSGGRYDPATDSWTPTSNVDAPAGRHDPTAVWTGSRMVVWGGRNTGYENTGGRYDPISDLWEPTSTAGAPSGRYGHTAVWTGSRMVVWGGYLYSDTGGRYDPDSDLWTPTSIVNAPIGRFGPTAVWTGSEMIVWGGTRGTGDNNFFGGRYDPVTDAWTTVAYGGAPSGRFQHRAVWTGSEMVVWGGNLDDGFGGANTGGRYDPVSDSWTPTSMVDAPLGRFAHTAVWTPVGMIVWGGYTSGDYTSTGARYDPSLDRWTPIATENAPKSRSLATAVWAGDQMIVWGGWNGGPLNSGGRYVPSED